MDEILSFLCPDLPAPSDVLDDYEAILRNGTFTNSGPMERALVQRVTDWIGPVHVAVVSSGTSAIELALLALGKRDRPEVLVASFTFAAGPLCALRLGYEPVFLDVDPCSWQPSLSAAKRYLDHHGTSVAAILLTNTFGVANPDLPLWEAAARSHGIPLIIDSAAGFGSTTPAGWPLGTGGDCEIFSMHATKTLAAGEGGLVTSRSPDLIAELDARKNFGFDSSRASYLVGTNAKLPELICAIALRQLAVLPDRIRARQALHAHYAEALEPLGFEFQPAADHSAIAFVSALAPTPAIRTHALTAMASRNIEARTYYNPPVHEQPLFCKYKRLGDLTHTISFASRILSLPTRTHLPEQGFRRVIDAIGDTTIQLASA
jgi:dTDP-4-amino-4,6-dideoxygalactose transaminase